MISRSATGPTPARVAVVHVADPRYVGGGADRRAQALYEAMAARFDASIHRVDAAGPVPLWDRARVRSALAGIPPRASQSGTAAVISEVGRLADEHDVIIGSTLMTSALVPRRDRGKLVFDAHNLEWHVVGELARRSASPARRLAYRATAGWTRSFEARLATSSAAVWAVSPAEANWFQERGARAVLVPNGVDIPGESPPGSDPELLFVGSLTSEFNREAIQWFLGEVWPRVRVSCPQARLKVIGSGPPLPAPEGVAMLGFVEDLSPHYATARACLAPLRAGSGTRLKVLEAMAHARPVVSTTIGSEGLELGDTDGVLLRDDPAGFAGACCQLLTDAGVAARLGGQGRRRARAYSWDRVTAAAVDSVSEVLAGLGRPG